MVGWEKGASKTWLVLVICSVQIIRCRHLALEMYATRQFHFLKSFQASLMRSISIT